MRKGSGVHDGPEWVFTIARIRKLNLQNGSLCFFEYISGDFCDGKMNAHRLNVYLSKDGDFITVWHGLFDPAFIDQEFLNIIPEDENFDFYTAYNQNLFRGYIEDNKTAKVILKSLRYHKIPPQILLIDKDNRFSCESIQ